MPKTTPKQLAHLKALEAAATPGQWWTGDGDKRSHFHGAYAVIGTRKDKFCVLLEGNVNFPKEAEANAELATESRNALSALIADAEAYHALLAFIRERVQAMEREVAELIRTGHATHAVQVGMIAGAVEAVADWAENEEAVKEGADAQRT